ncbi:MAG: low molecular weight phosphotyrosine protein phosphatase [Flavobacteriales bacterium]|jgi:protein-tyrosine phosphatase|nr:low molecular weight phosphotyrosine protein phosphatase [Flavobacteriales bacterium]
MKHVLVVCLGNICRSPIGEGLIRHHAGIAGLSLQVDSAGTSGLHAHEPPDIRSQEVMLQHKLDIGNQRSRQLTTQDLNLFDVILVMDHENLKEAQALGSGDADIKLFVTGQNVPDPYYGGEQGFKQVYEMLDRAAEEWVSSWSRLQHTNS